MPKTTKSATPVEAVVVEAPAPAKSKKISYVSVGSIFWGFAFIFAGALLLLDNLGLVNVHFSSLIQLWPVFIIAAGVSMLSLRGWVAAIIAFCMVIAFGALALFISVDNPWFTSTRFDCDWRGSFEQCMQTTFDPSHWR